MNLLSQTSHGSVRVKRHLHRVIDTTTIPTKHETCAERLRYRCLPGVPHEYNFQTSLVQLTKRQTTAFGPDLSQKSLPSPSCERPATASIIATTSCATLEA